VVVSVGHGIASARRCGIPQGRRGCRGRPCRWNRVTTERSEARLTRTGGAGFIAGRNSPSLMLGYAGIGYGLLRAADLFSISSVLVIEGCDRRRSA
jgi:hypothetical protein